MNRRFLAVFLAALTGGGIALGQGGGDPDPAPASNEGGAPAQTEEVLTPAEQLTRAQSTVAKGQADVAEMQGMAARAQKQEDYLLLTCLKDRVKRAETNAEALVKRADSLEAAVEANDATLASHEYVVIEVLGEKIRVLRKEAAQCTGEGVFDTGNQTISSFVDPGTPLDDGTSPEEAPAGTIPFIPPPNTGTD